MIKKLFLFLCMSQLVLAQQAEEKVYDKNIKTIQLFNPETNDETPFIRQDKYFILSFDILNQGYQRLYYSIKHYDRNWNQDNLFESEYISGYNSAQINNFQPSFNTQQNYAHYTLQFPNNDMQAKITGNYVITVYNDAQKPLFNKRFSVYDTNAMVSIGYERYSNPSNPNINQRVTVESTLLTEGTPNTRQLSLCIIQNNNWKTALCDIEPQFINNNRLTFGQLTNSFEGGNEFYSFDTKTISVPGFGVEKVVQDEITGMYNTFLHAFTPDPMDYTYNPDVNGAFYIRRLDLSQEREGSTEGDYTYVNFAVNMNSPIKDKDLYVVGLFNNYRLTDENKMVYDPSGKFYEKTIFLKQGFYNYTIATVDQKTGKVSLSDIPGSFWQTENLYQGLIYYTPLGGTYDALIGYGEIRAARQ